MNRLLYIVRYPAFAVLLLLLLALAPARAETVVYLGKTTNLTVIEVKGNSYEWELYDDPSVDFAVLPGNCPVTSATFDGSHIGANVRVKWLKTGIYFFKVTARDALGCTNNLKVGIIRVIPIELEAIVSGATVTGACQLVKLDASKSIGDLVKYEWSMIDQGGALTNKTGITTEFLLLPLPVNCRQISG